MRRAVARTIRTTCRCPSRTTNPSFYLSYGFSLGVRPASTFTQRQVITSSMRWRGLSVAVAGVVAGGTWYTYRGPPTASNAVPSYLNRQSSTSTASQSTDATTKVVIITADQILTGDIPGDGPISKDTDESGRKLLEMLTPEQATQKLRRNEESYFVNRGQGVLRYDVVQIPSNDPIEDDHSEKIVEIPGDKSTSDWMFWGVFDGHSGWTTSAKLRQVLISFVARELNSTYTAASNDPRSGGIPSTEAVEAAIKTGFNRLDHEIIHESVEKVMKANSKLVAAELLAPALSGSCALLSFYDSRTNLLRVACTGDSRAILGRRGDSGKWVATPLSVDQTGGNPDEEARLRKQHPGEDYVIHKGRVLGGLEPTRAFGDASYKWTRETAEKIKSHFFGRSPSTLLKTPPYVTAEPVVTTTKIEPGKGDFLVMATDGLWEMLTNEEVVGLVGQWIEKQQTESNSVGNSWLGIFQGQQKALPVEQGPTAQGKKGDGQKTPIRQRQWGVTAAQSERFCNEDKNVATHLVRNALGGKDKDMVCALLTLPSPYSRRYRDDLTVEVIFFGNGEKSGNVTNNKEASANINDVTKPKL